jgi:hypothetical protein
MEIYGMIWNDMEVGSEKKVPMHFKGERIYYGYILGISEGGWDVSNKMMFWDIL